MGCQGSMTTPCRHVALREDRVWAAGRGCCGAAFQPQSRPIRQARQKRRDAEAELVPGKPQCRAMMATFAATGLRFDAARTLPIDGDDRVTGAFRAHEKGDVEGSPRLSPKAQRFMREYLARRSRRRQRASYGVPSAASRSRTGAATWFCGAPGSAAASRCCTPTCFGVGWFSMPRIRVPRRASART